MATKRTRVARRMAAGVSDEAVRHFREALRRLPAYLACRDKPYHERLKCDSDDCCRGFKDHERAMRRALGLHNWEITPLNVSAKDQGPPAYVLNHWDATLRERSIREYERAIELRRELEAA